MSKTEKLERVLRRLFASQRSTLEIVRYLRCHYVYRMSIASDRDVMVLRFDGTRADIVYRNPVIDEVATDSNRGPHEVLSVNFVQQKNL